MDGGGLQNDVGGGEERGRTGARESDRKWCPDTVVPPPDV